MDITLAIIIFVAIMYLLFIVGVLLFLRKRKKGMFKQTIDPKPNQLKFETKKEHE